MERKPDITILWGGKKNKHYWEETGNNISHI